MIVECVGLPGAGKTTICNAVTVAHGKKGAVPLTALRPRPALLKAAWQITMLCATARPFSFNRLKRGFNLAVFLRHYERRDLTILLDQGIVQKMWSILADVQEYPPARLVKVMITLKSFAPDHAIWIRTPIEVTALRLTERNRGTSRFDGLPRKNAEDQLRRTARLLEDLITQFRESAGTKVHQLSGLAAAADNAQKIEEIMLQANRRCPDD